MNSTVYVVGGMTLHVVEDEAPFIYEPILPPPMYIHDTGHEIKKKKEKNISKSTINKFGSISRLR